MSAEERTRVGAYAICLDDTGRILLCRIAPWVLSGEVWTLPGGGIDFGEAPATAALRELTEETGYVGEVIELADVSDHLFSGSTDGTEGDSVPMHAIRIVYRVRIVGGDLRDEVDGSTDTCGWFALDAAARLHLATLARRSLRTAAASIPAPSG
ncbi:MAG: NUDIX hydrolase [Chloroflexota bacterium]|jgi:8-oxo-dGTP diphosphatase